jgi:hypothetical protein
MRDNDRPPALAHLRFAAARESFAGLDLKHRFEKIHRTNLWGAEHSVSGLGSQPGATLAVARELPKLLGDLGVETLLDAPCGDASWIGGLKLKQRYIGIDIVPALISDLASRAAQGAIAGEFHLADITVDPLPAADAILCRDCLVHLSFANIARALHNFARSGARYLIATTFTGWRDNRDIEDGDWRPLNLRAPPFGFSEPLALLDEQCTEAEGGYADKCLGVWRLADISS